MLRTVLIAAFAAVLPTAEDALVKTIPAVDSPSIVADAIVPIPVGSGAWSMVTDLRDGPCLGIHRRGAGKPPVLVYQDHQLVLQGPQAVRSPLSKHMAAAKLWNGAMTLAVTGGGVIAAPDGVPVALPALPAGARGKIRPLGATEDSVVVLREAMAEALDGTTTTTRTVFAVDGATRAITQRELPATYHPDSTSGANATGYCMVLVQAKPGDPTTQRIFDLASWKEWDATIEPIWGRGVTSTNTPDGAVFAIASSNPSKATVQLVGVRGEADYPVRKQIGLGCSLLSHAFRGEKPTLTRLYGRWGPAVTLGGGYVALVDQENADATARFVVVIDAVNGRLVGSTTVGMYQAVANKVRPSILTAWQDGKNAYVYMVSPTQTKLTFTGEHIACWTVPLPASDTAGQPAK